MKLKAFCHYISTLACLLGASSLNHEKSFLYQDGASNVFAIAIYKDSLLLTVSNDVVQKDIQTGSIQRTFRAHQSLVYSFSVTNDSMMITSGFDDMIILWDLETGSILKRILLSRLDSRIRSIAVQNNLVVTGGLDSKARTIDLVSGRVVRTIDTDGFVFSVVVSGEFFYIGKQNQPNVVRYSTQRGSSNLAYDGHTDSVFSIFLYNDILISGSADTTVVCWNASNARTLRVLSGHTDFVRVVAIFDGFLYSAGGDTYVVKWNIENGQILQMFPTFHYHEIMSFAYKHSEIFTGSLDTSVIRWDSISGRRLVSYEGKNTKLNAVAAWKNFAISAGEDVEIKVWDSTIDSIEPLAIMINHTVSINCLCSYEDFLFSGGSDGTVKQWDMKQFIPKNTFEGKTIPNSNSHSLGQTSVIVSLTAFQGFLYSSGHSIDIYQWNISSGLLENRFVGHTGWIDSVTNDASSLYSGSNDKTIRMWNVQSLQSSKIFYSVDSVRAVWRTQDSILACASESLQSFSVASGETLAFFKEPNGCSSIVSLLERAYTGHSDGVIRVRDLYTLNVMKTYSGHSDYVTWLCFDDSYNLFSTGFDGTIKKWNLLARKVAYSFEIRSKAVTALAVSGKNLYVGTLGGNIFSYNTDDAKAVKELRYFNQRVTSLLVLNCSVYGSSLDGLLLKFIDGTKDVVSALYNSNLEPVRSLTANNNYVVSLHGEEKVVIFSNDSFRRTLDFPAVMVCIAATDRFLLGGTRSGVIYSWNIESFELSLELKGHISQVNHLLPVHQRLFSASDDKSIIEWSLKDGISINAYQRLSARVLGHLGSVNSLSFCFGTLFSAGSDLSVRRWNTATGRHEDVYIGFSDIVTSVTCINGSVFAGSEDFSVLMFRPVFDDLSRATTSSKALITTGKRKASRIVRGSQSHVSPETSILALTVGLVFLVILLVGFGALFSFSRIQKKEIAAKTSSKTQNESSFTVTDLQTVVNSIVGISKHAEFLLQSSAIAKVRRIARGGGGELFIAKVMDPLLQKKVGDTVIQKVVFVSSKSHEEAFFQEVGIMIMLSTFPHFCQIIGYTENPLSMILKFYLHGSLNEWLRENQATRLFAVKLLKELAEALNAMHSHFLAHCDIKPQNILMQIENGVPSCFLTDFGITQILSDEILASRMFNVTNLRGLSVNYASPEAFTNFRSKRYNLVDFLKYDIYSFACVVYDFVSARPPWNNSYEFN
ncbi:hypothetical protein MP638_006610 [Amoeboaphelidium occidentale]|nr:hypothetical protein MP638_006610 [Amoeboaphelidium occidentale]